MNVEEITRFPVAKLKDILKELRLPSSGLKAVFQERVILLADFELHSNTAGWTDRQKFICSYS